MIDAAGDKCRELARRGLAAIAHDDKLWFAEHCHRLSVYTVKIAAGTNHSGFVVEPAVPHATSSAESQPSPESHINFGAAGLYRTPKWDLQHARYRPLRFISTSELTEIELEHTTKRAGIYNWLLNCCHHNTQRVCAAIGHNASEARSVTWFDESKVKGGLN
jgi:hypothetical protein